MASKIRPSVSDYSAMWKRVLSTRSKLESNEEVMKSLQEKFKEAGWISKKSIRFTFVDLATAVNTKIRKDCSIYEVFGRMLAELGLKDILPTLDDMEADVVMPTKTVIVMETRRSGRSTNEYKTLLTKLEALQRTLQATKGATKSLNSKFKTASWQDIAVECDAQELVQKGLSKIENDAHNYELFYTMLKDITGLDIDFLHHPDKLSESGSQSEDSGFSSNVDNNTPTNEKAEETPQSNSNPITTENSSPIVQEELIDDANVAVNATIRMDKRINELKQQVKDEIERKLVLQQENEELSRQLSLLRVSVNEKEKEMEMKLKEKKEELEKLKKRLSQAEKERAELESKYKKEVEALNEEIARLKKELSDEKQRGELQITKLQMNLFKSEKELALKDIIILTAQNEQLKLEKNVIIHEKDLETQRLERKLKSAIPNVGVKPEECTSNTVTNSDVVVVGQSSKNRRGSYNEIQQTLAEHEVKIRKLQEQVKSEKEDKEGFGQHYQALSEEIASLKKSMDDYKKNKESEINSYKQKIVELEKEKVEDKREIESLKEKVARTVTYSSDVDS